MKYISFILLLSCFKISTLSAQQSAEKNFFSTKDRFTHLLGQLQVFELDPDLTDHASVITTRWTQNEPIKRYLPPSKRTRDTSLEIRFKSMLDSLPARTSMYAKNLSTGQDIAIRADIPMNTLSVIKIPIMVLAFREAEKGNLDLEERYEIKNSHLRRGSGLIQTFQPGIRPTIRDVVTQMIITSDNTATDIMISRLGLKNVNAFLSEQGYEQTRLLTTTGQLFRRVWEMQDSAFSQLSHNEVYKMGFPNDPQSADRRFDFEGDPNEWLGKTTAREMSQLLEQISQNRLVSHASSTEMISILKGQFYSSRLPRFIRFDVAVAHKTGDWPPVAGNDVGILFHEGGPTIVSVFVNQNRGDFNEVEKTIGLIAQELVQEWSP